MAITFVNALEFAMRCERPVVASREQRSLLHERRYTTLCGPSRSVVSVVRKPFDAALDGGFVKATTHKEDKRARANEAQRAYRLRNPDKAKENQRLYARSEKGKAAHQRAAEKWRAANPETVKESLARYKRSEKGKATQIRASLKYWSTASNKMLKELMSNV